MTETASANAHIGNPTALLRRLTRCRSLTSLPKSARIASIVLIAIVAAVALAPLWIHDPDKLYLMDQGSNPSAQHLLGVDTGGHDILQRLLAGGRISLFYPLVVVVISTIVGVALAVAAAFFGGWVDSVVTAVTNTLFAVPGVLLVILAQAIFGVNMQIVVAALIISYVPFVTRLVRAQAVREASMEYIAALRIQGVSGWGICTRHLLRNVWSYAMAQATLAFGYASLDLAAVSFIGLGVQPPSADWGLMVANGLPGLTTGQPQEALCAGAALVVTIVAVNVLSNGLSRRSTR